jgi:4'-phosphopantetheinyl transferase EntD
MRVGVDVELLHDKIERIQHKFIYDAEIKALQAQCAMPLKQALTLYWSVKETVFKWWGNGVVDFKDDIVIRSIQGRPGQGMVQCIFKNEFTLDVQYLFFNDNFLTWVITAQ